MTSKLHRRNPPPTAKSETSNANITVTKQSLYSGPLPHPDLLKQFKEIDESYPERIFKMTERYQEADVKALDRTSRANFVVPILGQVFTLIIALSGIGAGVALAQKGFSAPAIAAIICGFSTILVAALKNLKAK